MQAIRPDGTVLEGLYATGDCSGSMFANNYPELFPGVACGRTLTFAKHAVEHMVASGMATGKAWFKVPGAIKFVLTGKPAKWISG